MTDLLKESDDIQISVTENTSSLTIMNITMESVGFYNCKVINEVGMVISRAKLDLASGVAKFVEDESIVNETEIATEELHEENEDTVDTEKTTEQTNAIKVTVTHKPKLKKKRKMRTEMQIMPPQTIRLPNNLKKSAKNTTESVQKTVQISSVVKEDVREETDIEIHEEVEEIKIKIYKEILSSEDVDNIKLAKEINEIMDELEIDKLGTGQMPLRELVTIGYLMKRGMNITDIMQMYAQNAFPELSTPHAQSALVQLVQREGYGNLITEVLDNEGNDSDNEDDVATKVGFKAFIKMVELNEFSIEEVITHFVADDFITQEWKYSESREVS